jgi:hypothetical protein
MRFSAAITLPLPFRVPASEPALRAAAPLAEPQPAQPQPAARELPQELDQRVRELGEW